jgi:hypothetical protein
MLNWSFVLERIKEELSFPFHYIEKTDEEIIDYCKRNALKKYDTFFPQKWRITIDSEDTTIKVPDRTTEYYIIDPDSRDIFNVVDFIPDIGPLLMTGHPWIGVFTYGELESFTLRAHMANTTKLYSNWNYNTEFIYPNILRVTPKWSGRAVIEYERANDQELSTIPNDRHDIFVDLCVSMVFMMIGRIRKKFTPLQTPFGEIQIAGEDIANEGKELYEKTIEVLKTGSMPNVIFDHG